MLLRFNSYMWFGWFISIFINTNDISNYALIYSILWLKYTIFMKGAADLRSRWDIRTFSWLFVGPSGLNFFPGGQIGAYISMQSFIKFTEKEEKP